MCHILLNSFQGLQLCFRHNFNRRSAHKIMGPQSCESPNLGNFETPTCESGDKMTFGLALWLSTKNIIRGKVVASLNFGLWWVLWVRVCPCFVRAQKCSNYALTYLLFGLCKSMWINDLLATFPNLIPKLKYAPLPPKCYEPRNALQLLLLPLFSPLDSQLNLSRSLGVHHQKLQMCVT